MKKVGLRRKKPSFGPCMLSVSRKVGGAAGACTTHIEDIPGCGEPDVPAKIGAFFIVSFWGDEVVDAGVESLRGSDFSVRLTQAEFTQKLQLLSTPSGERAVIRKILSPEDGKLRQRKMGELCWLEAV